MTDPWDSSMTPSRQFSSPYQLVPNVTFPHCYRQTFPIPIQYSDVGLHQACRVDENPGFIPVESLDYESFRPSNLPPKNPREAAYHNQQVRKLDVCYRHRLQQRAVGEALKQMKTSQREFRRNTLNQLWLTRFLPELVQRVSVGEPMGPEIEKAWRQGLPPGIRKVVWPLAISNSLRITPELFEILSLKALELRTLEKLSSEQIGGPSDGRTRKRPKLDDPTLDLLSCPCSPLNSRRVSPSPGSDSDVEPDQKTREETLIRSSLKEIFKRSKYNRNNRESSLVCIDLDLPRTFPQLRLFQKNPEEGSSLHLTLQRLLEGWVCYRPDVGYVQGMSFLAALLLVYLDQFPAFVCFCNLLSSPALLGLYKMDPALIAKRYRIFDLLLEKENPRLFQYFHELKFPREAYLLEWFLTLFAKSLSLDMASYIWDLLFLDGEVTLFVAAVAILNIVSERILPQVLKSKPKGTVGQFRQRPFLSSASEVSSLQDTELMSEDDESILHHDFDRIRHVLANIRHYITDEGELLGMMTTIKSKMSNEILREIKLIGSIEFSALCCPEKD